MGINPRPTLERSSSHTPSQCLAFISRSLFQTLPLFLRVPSRSTALATRRVPPARSGSDIRPRMATASCVRNPLFFLSSHHAIKGKLRSLAVMCVWGNKSFSLVTAWVRCVHERWKGRTVMMSDIDDYLDHQNEAIRCEGRVGHAPLPRQGTHHT